MEQINLKVVRREEKGKQQVKKLRAKGLVPGVVYARGGTPVEITLSDREISRIIHNAGGENILINLTIEKDKKPKPRSVIIKEVQHDPVRRSILHVDFNEISLTENITVEVEVVAQGEPVGVKQEGGILDHPLRMLKVQCLPTDIPKRIDVDVSDLKLNGSIHVKDLHVTDKVKILNDPETLLFQVKLPAVEEKVEEAAEGTPEVEVLREKKEAPPPPAGRAGAGKPEEGKPGEKAKEEPKAKEAAKPEKK